MLTTAKVGALCSAPFSFVDALTMAPFLRLVRCDNRTPLLLTLCNEHGDEIASATATADEAVHCAIMLLARAQTLRPGYRLTVATPDG